MKTADFPIKTIPLASVIFDDHFWNNRLETNRLVTIPHILRKLKKSRRIANFEIAGGISPHKRPSKLPFDDSDVFKTIEGIAHSLKLNPDPRLEQITDEIIAKIETAQEEDGYIYTNRTINPEKPHSIAGKNRWEEVSIFSHELYNVGHLYEAAITYFEATGKKKLLKVALKNAELILNEFGYNKNEDPPGHQEIELGLIRMFRSIGDERYLDLAKFFLDIRGSKARRGYERYSKLSEKLSPWKGPERLMYNQSHKPVIEQKEAVGHAVRATYMYAAMTEIAALYNEVNYSKAVDQIWEDLISNKLSITGGIGARADIEGFDAPYLLPNFIDRRIEKGVYNETCASIGSIFWNFRLFLLYGNAKYIDILERTLFNGFLSGISLEGDKFFYPNPLASKGDIKRRSWYEVSCCPTNIVRFIPQIQGYIYALKENMLYINLYIGSEVKIEINKTYVHVKQKSNYPWNGSIEISVDPKKKTEFSLAFRIPGWSQNKPLPSNLYRYLNPSNDQELQVSLNGQNLDLNIDDKGYFIIKREWSVGDKIRMNIPMPIKKVISNEKVSINLGKIALERGPIVYCFESIDNQDVFNIKVPENAQLNHQYQEKLLGGVEIIKISRIDKKQSNIVAFGIPYYAWAHRDKSEMVVWVDYEKSF